MSFRDCISSALSQGALSKEEAADLVRRFEALEEGERINPGKPAGYAKMKLVEDLRAEGIEAKRKQLLQERASERNDRDIASRNPLVKGAADISGAAYRLFENFGDAGYMGVRGIYAGLLGAAHSEMADSLHAFRRSALTMRRFNRPALDEIPRAAFGEANASPEAHGFYTAFRKVADKLRDMFNEAGGHIGHDESFLPMHHSQAALIKAQFEKWRDFITTRLDWDKMRHAISGGEILPSERERVLQHVYDSITTDGWNTREPTLGGGRPALYNRRADPRFLKFKDGDSWLDYNRAFGTGEVFSTMLNHVESMARDVALMQRLGPNPHAEMQRLQQVIEREGARLKNGQPSLFKKPKGVDVNTAVRNAKGKLEGLYDVARGAAVPHGLIPDTIAIARAGQYSSKLGGAAIMHTFANPVIAAAGRYFHDIPLTTLPMDLLRGFKNEHEMTAAGLIMQDAANTLERGARERGSLLKLRELSRWLPAWTTHYSALEAVVNANRRGSFLGSMETFASHLDTHWSTLPDRLRNMMEGYGMNEGDWALMREAVPHEPERGAKFLRWTDIRDTGLEGAEATALKYNGMLHMIVENLVPSSNWRSRGFAQRIDNANPIAGEVWRSIAMFKSGFMATFMMTQLQMFQREVALKQGLVRASLATGGAVGATAAGYIGSMVTGLTVAGMVVLQLKSMRAGKGFLSIDPTTKQGRETWEHAFLTGGALGIYGDFIHSDQSSYGHDIRATILGPMVTGAIDTWHGITGMLAYSKAQAGLGEPAKKPPNPGADAVKWLRNNTPVLSTHWALSAAYNRLILDQLQYAVDPSAHTKMRDRERRLIKDTGQTYWWRPGALAPDRLPQMAR